MARRLYINVPTEDARIDNRVTAHGTLWDVSLVVPNTTSDGTTLVAARRVDGKEPTTKIRNPNSVYDGFYQLTKP